MINIPKNNILFQYSENKKLTTTGDFETLNIEEVYMNQDLEIPEEVRAYLEGLLQDSGMVIEDSAREEVIKELYARLDNYLASVILENIPQDQVDDFISVSGEKKTLPEMQEYLLSKLPNAKEVLTKAFIDFRQLYLGNVAVAREAENLGQSQ